MQWQELSCTGLGCGGRWPEHPYDLAILDSEALVDQFVSARIQISLLIWEPYSACWNWRWMWGTGASSHTDPANRHRNEGCDLFTSDAKKCCLDISSYHGPVRPELLQCIFLHFSPILVLQQLYKFGLVHLFLLGDQFSIQTYWCFV